MNIKTKKYSCVFLCLICIALISTPLRAQVKRPLSDADKSALESVEVEKYYTYTAADKMDTLGGCLPKGAVTYRIYIDLKPGYSLQAVYGVLNHPLFIKTSTLFFNNTQYGQGTGDYIDHKKMLGSTASFDSFLTMGAASNSDMGVPKADDKDGSLIKANSFASADGLMAAKIKPVTYFGIIPNFFNTYNPANTFTTDNGSWAVFGGVTGATESNKILIAQLTTDGVLSYELNIQVGTPNGGSINYVAKNPQEQEIKFDALTKAIN
ncbi:MAG: hypothetical protein JWP12_693 [Bacteroidetes bacterium]|nr:hypothetical protein [Bacteroidota bacterium]